MSKIAPGFLPFTLEFKMFVGHFLHPLSTQWESSHCSLEFASGGVHTPSENNTSSLLFSIPGFQRSCVPEVLG